MPVSNGLAPVYDRSGQLLDGYAAELSGAPAVTRALPHARAPTRARTHTPHDRARLVPLRALSRFAAAAQHAHCGRAGAGLRRRLEEIEVDFRHGPGAAASATRRGLR